MKISLFLFLIYLSYSSFAQFSLETEWFTAENFFIQKDIKTKQIKSIRITKSNKKDNETFSKDAVIALYYFSKNGYLNESQSYVQMRRRVDTSTFTFKYYTNGSLQSRTEKQGLFSFIYHFENKRDALHETKIDNNTKDTNYTHYSLTSKLSSTKELTTVYNSINRPMKEIRVERDIFGQIILLRENYARSLSFVEYSFEYNATQLTSKSKWNTIGKQTKEKWVYTYINGFVDEIIVTKDNQRIEKYGLLYDNNNLIKAIVMRDMIEKSVRIYKINYEFYR